MILTYLCAFIKVHLMQIICDQYISRNCISLGRSRVSIFFFFTEEKGRAGERERETDIREKH